VAFHLTRPDADFLSKLALTGADAVPTGTPPPSPKGDQVPATGPYEIASYHRGRSLTLVRNRHFEQWSADAQPAGYPERIVFTFFPPSRGGSSAAQRVVDGHADVVPGLCCSLSRGQLVGFATRYASQVRLTPNLSTDFYFLNTHVPPFDDARVRRAVNLAFDRHAYQKVVGPGYQATCQVLPPDFPSYRRTCPYGSAGAAAVRRAQRLVQDAGQSGTRVTVWMPGPGRAEGRFMVSVLNRIGLRAQPKLVPLVHNIGDYFGAIHTPNNHAQIGYDNWSADYPSDGGFLPSLLGCSGFNGGFFCDRHVDGLFAAAERAQNPYDASALWRRAERAVLARAPIVPADNGKNVAFLAKGVGNFQFHPEWGVLLDQLWVK
jgi:peptide/nickel transport system substrate-binding protein